MYQTPPEEKLKEKKKRKGRFSKIDIVVKIKKNEKLDPKRRIAPQ